MSWQDFQKKSKELKQQLLNNSGSNGGSIPTWKYRYMNFRSEGRCWVRLHKDFHLYYSKWVKGRGGKSKEVISNSHNGELENVPDLIYWNVLTKKDSKLQAAKRRAVSLTQLEYFHEYSVTPEGENKRAYLKYERCTGKKQLGKPACKFCTAEEAAGEKATSKRIFGQRAWWGMSVKEEDELRDSVHKKMNSCLSCGKGEVHPTKFSCPECKTLLVNCFEQDVDETSLAELLSSDNTCPECGHKGKLDVSFSCLLLDGNEVTKGCSNPQRLPLDTSIFDVEFQVEKDTSTYVVTVHKVRPIAKHEDLPGNMLQPLPLHLFLDYMLIKDQAEAMNIANPWGKDADDDLLEYFAEAHKKYAVASKAPSEEADENSIPWSKTK